jgi:hypothetical protein
MSDKKDPEELITYEFTDGTVVECTYEQAEKFAELEWLADMAERGDESIRDQLELASRRGDVVKIDTGADEPSYIHKDQVN